MYNVSEKLIERRTPLMGVAEKLGVLKNVCWEKWGLEM
jgi:hypothetical protein